MKLLRICAGTQLFDAGEVIADVDVVVEGRFALHGPRGNDFITIVERGACLVAPEQPERHPWWATALTPAIVARFDGRALTAAGQSNDLLSTFVSLLSIGPLAQRASPDRSLPVLARVASELLRCAAGRHEFELILTQEHLGAHIGASRERVNKAIAALVDANVVARNDRHYRVLDIALLASAAGEAVGARRGGKLERRSCFRDL